MVSFTDDERRLLLGLAIERRDQLRRVSITSVLETNPSTDRHDVENIIAKLEKDELSCLPHPSQK